MAQDFEMVDLPSAKARRVIPEEVVAAKRTAKEQFEIESREADRTVEAKGRKAQKQWLVSNCWNFRRLKSKIGLFTQAYKF